MKAIPDSNTGGCSGTYSHGRAAPFCSGTAVVVGKRAIAVVATGTVRIQSFNGWQKKIKIAKTRGEMWKVIFISCKWEKSTFWFKNHLWGKNCIHWRMEKIACHVKERIP